MNIEQSLFKYINNPLIFKIYYRRELQKYYLETVEDNSINFYIFILIEKPFLLRTETIIISIQNYNFKIKVSSEYIFM